MGGGRVREKERKYLRSSVGMFKKGNRTRFNLIENIC